jgi:hypothetical protein
VKVNGYMTTTVKCGLCKGFKFVKVKKCKHCIVCPHCRGLGEFEIGNSKDFGNIRRTVRLAQNIAKYKDDYIAYNEHNRPPLKIVIDKKPPLRLVMNG